MTLAAGSTKQQGLFGQPTAPARRRTVGARSEIRSLDVPTHPIPFPSTDDRTVAEIVSSLPTRDNTPEALESLLSANRRLRQLEWPEPYRTTNHRVCRGDAR